MNNGRYAGISELELLDIDVPGTLNTQFGGKRIATKYFIYSPTGSGVSTDLLALAQRLKTENQTSINVYFLSIRADDPERIHCTAPSGGAATAVQRKLCQQLNATGTL